MSDLRLMTIVGTRPEIIRLSCLIRLLDQHFEHYFVHTGQNNSASLKDIFFTDLGIRQPDAYLEASDSTLGATLGHIFVGIEKVLDQFRPDAVLILGDTNSSLAAILCERRQIPVYHMEAGNRSFDSNVPEELNRKLVDHVSTFNLPYNKYSRENLLREGFHPRFIQVTGSPMAEVIRSQRSRIEASQVLETLGLTNGEYFVVSVHRQENVDDAGRLSLLIDSLNLVAGEWGLPVVVSTHPRTAKRLDLLGKQVSRQIRFLEPFNYSDYVRLQSHSLAVISDSGTVSEEAALLNFKAVTWRNGIERFEGIENGSILMSDAGSPSAVVSGLKMILTYHKSSGALPDGYEVQDFSWRVASFVESTARFANSWLNRRVL